MMNRPLTWAADGLFPHFCVDCGREGAAMCSHCFARTMARMTGFFVCPGCAAPSPWGGQCGRPSCRRRSSLDGIISAASYADRGCRELLHQYKYEGVDGAGSLLSELFRRFASGMKPVMASIGTEAIIGLPLHRFRMALRGFNQSAIFGRALGEAVGLPYVAGLVRRKFLWQRQVQMKDERQRRRNASGSFFVPKSVTVPENILIVDDVYTTGATLDACAAALKSAGAKRVWGMTVLRG